MLLVGSDQSRLLRDADRTRASVDVQLAEDVPEVALYGGFGDEERAGDLSVRGTGRDEA